MLLPTHKSYLDMWVLGLIHLAQGIEYPFSYGEQSIIKLAIVATLM